MSDGSSGVSSPVPSRAARPGRPAGTDHPGANTIAPAPLLRSGRGRRKAPGEGLAYPAMASRSRPVNVRSSEGLHDRRAMGFAFGSTHPTNAPRLSPSPAKREREAQSAG